MRTGDTAAHTQKTRPDCTALHPAVGAQHSGRLSTAAAAAADAAAAVARTAMNAVGCTELDPRRRNEAAGCRIGAGSLAARTEGPADPDLSGGGGGGVVNANYGIFRLSG
jgi:hypothetical protein